MAKLATTNLSSLDFDLNIEAIPDGILNRMLESGAKVVAQEQGKQAAALLGTKGRGTGTTAKSVTVKAPKKSKGGGREISITFDGSRPSGSKTKRNAEVAYLQEYGTSKQGAVQFIRIANEKSADEALEAQLAVYDEWLDSVL